MSYVGWRNSGVSPVRGVWAPTGRLAGAAPGAAFSTVDTDSAVLRSWEDGPFLGLSPAPRNSCQASETSVKGEQALVPSSDGAGGWVLPSSPRPGPHSVSRWLRLLTPASGAAWGLHSPSLFCWLMGSRGILPRNRRNLVFSIQPSHWLSHCECAEVRAQSARRPDKDIRPSNLTYCSIFHSRLEAQELVSL